MFLAQQNSHILVFNNLRRLNLKDAEEIQKKKKKSSELSAHLIFKTFQYGKLT